jgi:Flp pilus assembly pilin Flp
MEEDGISAMEYSLIGALIVVGVITTTHELSISLQDNIYEVVGAMAEVI